MEIRITIKSKKTGNLYTRKAITTDWLTSYGERYQTAHDGKRRYHPITTDTVNGRTQTIWEIKD